MTGLGRFGGIAGSFLIGELAASHLGFGTIFTVMALPAIIGDGCTVGEASSVSRSRHHSAPGSKAEVLGR